jgi:DUF438 domain-containing protein
LANSNKKIKYKWEIFLLTDICIILFHKGDLYMSEEKLSDLISPEAVINFESSAIKASTLDSIIKLLPFEMGFCDANDIFRWYSNNPDRVHGRRKEAIGRPVLELHPTIILPKPSVMAFSFNS